jgi:hypothetical protein
LFQQYLEEQNDKFAAYWIEAKVLWDRALAVGDEDAIDMIPFIIHSNLLWRIVFFPCHDQV